MHALGEHDFVIGWYEKTPQAVLVPRIGRWSRDGRQRWVEMLAPNGRNTVVRVDGDLVFAAWMQDEEEGRAGVWAGWWRATGEVAVPARRVADAGRTTWNLNAAVAPGSTPAAPRAWVVFDAKMGSRSDDLPRSRGRVSQPCHAVNPRRRHLVQVPGRQPGRRSGGDYLVRHRGHQRGCLPGGGTRLELLRHDGLSTAKATRVTSTPGHSIGAYVTWNGPRVGLAWCDDTVGQHEVYVQTFDPAGRPQAPRSASPRRRTGRGFPQSSRGVRVSRWHGPSMKPRIPEPMGTGARKSRCGWFPRAPVFGLRSSVITSAGGRGPRRAPARTSFTSAWRRTQHSSG